MPSVESEILSGKRILLLEEQAIGDVMQFLTLIRPLLHEASSVALLISDRLTPLYQRAFKSEVSSGSLHIIPFSKINLISSAFKRLIINHRSGQYVSIVLLILNIMAIICLFFVLTRS